MMRAFFNSLSPSKAKAVEEEDDEGELLEDDTTFSPTASPHFMDEASSSSSSARYMSDQISQSHTSTSYYDSYQHRLFDHLDSEFDPSLDEAEILELGMSNEMLSDELYLPSHPSRDWIRCYISSTGPGTYRMYLEGKRRVRFLMSAKQFTTGATFLISSNEDFPILEIVPKAGYIARLEKQKDLSYLLCLNYCHLCDSRLGCFTCGRGGREREIIAKISHYFRMFRPVNLQYRCVNVYIPSISRTGKRKIWCPRSFRLAFGDNHIGPEVDVNTAITRDRNQESYMVFRNKIPEWNQDLQSLVVKFHGNRILTASARNFLLCANLSETTTSTSSIIYCSDDEDDAIPTQQSAASISSNTSYNQTNTNTAPTSGSSIGANSNRGRFATIQAIGGVVTSAPPVPSNNSNTNNTTARSRKHSESFDSNLTWNPLAHQQAQQQALQATQQLKSRSRSRGSSMGSTPRISRRKASSSFSSTSSTTAASSSSGGTSATVNNVGIATPGGGNSPTTSGKNSVTSSPQQEHPVLKRQPSMTKAIIPAPNYPGIV